MKVVLLHLAKKPVCKPFYNLDKLQEQAKTYVAGGELHQDRAAQCGQEWPVAPERHHRCRLSPSVRTNNANLPYSC